MTFQDNWKWRVCIASIGCLPDSDEYPYDVVGYDDAAEALKAELETSRDGSWGDTMTAREFDRLEAEALNDLREGNNVMINIGGLYYLTMGRVSDAERAAEQAEETEQERRGRESLDRILKQEAVVARIKIGGMLIWGEFVGPSRMVELCRIGDGGYSADSRGEIHEVVVSMEPKILIDDWNPTLDEYVGFEYNDGGIMYNEEGATK